MDGLGIRFAAAAAVGALPATVTASDVKVTATDGQSITVAPNAKLTIK
jgi:hypothetical protein